MPALKVCGRIWEFGSDDLFFPLLASVIIRSIWFVGMLSGVLFYREALGCQHMNYIAGFSAGLLFITLVGILVESVTIFFSARGSIVHLKPRRPIVPLIYLRALVLLLEFVLLMCGTVLVVLSARQEDEEDCPSLASAIIMMEVVVGAYWFAFLLFVLITMIYLDPCHCYSAKVDYSEVSTRIREEDINEEVIETQWKLVHTVWEKRFKVACCLAGSDDVHQLAYREVAEIFAHLFCDTNVVMSDIAAGLILLQKEHLALEEAERKRGRQLDASADGEEEPRFSFDFHHPEDRDLFKDALHFIKYALGMYSWPIYVYMNPFCGLCRLYSHLNCSCRRRQVETEHIHEDNRCQCYLGGLRRITGLNEADIIYVSFENDVYVVPYMVCLDHETSSVILAFRGTLSFGDIVTDLTASTKPIELPDFPNFLVHKGMLKTVTSVLEKLREGGILESAFNKVNRSYKLVLVGHSLGSGCACIAAILLRDIYPDLRCFCYSPTGALLNEAAAAFTEDFVTSVILGKDLVARLNVPNTHKLKDDLVRVIESCRKPKCQILIEGCLETLCTCFGGTVVFDDAEADPKKVVNDGDDARRKVAVTLDSESESSSAVNNDTSLEAEADSLPLLVDPEEAIIRPSSMSPRRVSSSSPTERNVDRKKMERIPILLPKLSSLRLPVRSSSGNASPISSLTHEVERRLVPLFPPGKIIHIVDNLTNKACFCGTRQLEVTWSSRDKFNRISVSPEMIRDHFPDVVFRAMRKIWNKKRAELEDSSIRRHHQK